MPCVTAYEVLVIVTVAVAVAVLTKGVGVLVVEFDVGLLVGPHEEKKKDTLKGKQIKKAIVIFVFILGLLEAGLVRILP